MKLVDMSMVFQCTELRMSNCNGSRVLSIKYVFKHSTDRHVRIFSFPKQWY
jgi:hypothetical protein